jgi:predicted NBD/HSP70 family sugar kinase
LEDHSQSRQRKNLAAILHVLHQDGPASRADLADRTGLTTGSLAYLLGTLSEAGLVAEQALDSVAGGRHLPGVAVDGHLNVVVAIEISVDSIALAVVGLGGVILRETRRERSRDRTPVTETIADVAELFAEVEDLLAERRLLGVGVANAGLVRRGGQVVENSPNLGWTEVPLGDLLRDLFGSEIPIVIGNEADLGALAECRRGAAVGIEHLIFIFCEVGVGGGLVAGGRPISGADGFAGELGHMPVNPDGVPCQCGSVGCWETEVGEGALLRRGGRPADGGRAGIDALIESAVAGDDVALGAIAEQGRWIGIGVAGLVNALNPQMVVLSGLFERIYPLTVNSIDETFKRKALAESARRVKILPSSLGDSVLLVGAAEAAFDQVFLDPVS